MLIKNTQNTNKSKFSILGQAERNTYLVSTNEGTEKYIYFSAFLSTQMGGLGKACGFVS